MGMVATTVIGLTFKRPMRVGGKEPKTRLPVLLQHDGKMVTAGWDVLIVFLPNATN
jgi:hypothetical protein